MKHTKIVCTIGPASQSKTRLVQMMRAGMNVARLNFSHGEYTDHAKLIRIIRAASKEVGRPIALLQDLQGPRIRIGEVPRTGIQISKGDTVVLLTQTEYEKYGGKDHIPIPVQYKDLYKYVKKKGHIYIQDGIIDLKVERVADKKIYCRVLQDATVFSHKGFNAPGVTLKTEVITKKDKQDLQFGIHQDIDYVALSFVSNANDVRQLRSLIPKSKQIKVIAKIERQEAVDHFDEILDAADGIMIARGDLGVELGPAAVPLLQKDMIMKCVQVAKPVIVATQMLESMVNNSRPTRAEASDVANAIIDHADAVMLSAESATGKFPVKAVRTMTQIAHTVEESRYDDLPEELIQHRQETKKRGIAHASVELAESVDASLIVLFTHTGVEAAYISQMRPQKARIIALTDDTRVMRQLWLYWGVRAFKSARPTNMNDFIQKAKRQIVQRKLGKKGASAVILLGAGKRKKLQSTQVVTL